LEETSLFKYNFYKGVLSDCMSCAEPDDLGHCGLLSEPTLREKAHQITFTWWHRRSTQERKKRETAQAVDYPPLKLRKVTYNLGLTASEVVRLIGLLLVLASQKIVRNVQKNVAVC